MDNYKAYKTDPSKFKWKIKIHTSVQNKEHNEWKLRHNTDRHFEHFKRVHIGIEPVVLGGGFPQNGRDLQRSHTIS